MKRVCQNATSFNFLSLHMHVTLPDNRMSTSWATGKCTMLINTFLNDLFIHKMHPVQFIRYLKFAHSGLAQTISLLQKLLTVNAKTKQKNQPPKQTSLRQLSYIAFYLFADFFIICAFCTYQHVHITALHYPAESQQLS